MPAESAAATDASVATTTAEESAAPETTSTATPGSSLSEASASRLTSILEEEGMSETEIQEAVQPKDQPQSHAKEKEDAGTDRAQERAGDSPGSVAEGQVEGERRKAEGGKADAESQAGEKEEEPALTEQEQKSWPPEALRRIGKLTAKKSAEKAARIEAERIAVEQNTLARQLHAQLQDTSRVRPAPTQNDPLADVFTAQHLQTAIDENEELLEWAELNPDGAQDVVVGKDAEGKPITRNYSAQDIAKIKATTGRILRQAVPAKAGWLAERQQHEQYARATLPEMFQEGTPENIAYQQVLQNVPELFSRLPGADQWVGWGIIGREISASGVPLAEVRAVIAQMAATRKANGAANGNGKTKVVDPKVAPFLQKHAPQAPGMPGGGTRMQPSEPGSKARVTQAAERAQTGDEEAEVDFIGALRESQKPGAALV